MPYSNAIFHLDLESGSDASRTSLLSCVASNPSGTIVRITKTSHGLATGAVVDLTLFDSWLNGAWKITVISTSTFDLDGAVWQATVDNTGTVTPRGGSSWTDAWRTAAYAFTGSRVQDGDEVRIAKSTDFSIGNSTWATSSNIITLTSSTSLIDNCEANWQPVPAGFVAQGDTLFNMQGSSANGVRRTTSFSALLQNTRLAYRQTTSTLNLSSFTAITFVIINLSSIAIINNNFKLCLCSDTIGSTIVDTFPIVFGEILGPNRYFYMTISRQGGGALGSSIRSIALYTHTVTTGIATSLFSLCFDNISAINNTTSINLNSILYHSASNEYWQIKNIEQNNVVTLDFSTGRSVNLNNSKTYAGPNRTIPLRAINYQNSRLSGSSPIIDRSISIVGGWNKSSNIVDGATVFQHWYHNDSARRNRLDLRANDVSIHNIVFLRFGIFFNNGLNRSVNNLLINNCHFVGNATLSSNSFTVAAAITPEAGGGGPVNNHLLQNCTINQCGDPTLTSQALFLTDSRITNSSYKNCKFINNYESLLVSPQNIDVIENCRIENNSDFFYIQPAINKNLFKNTKIINCSFSSSLNNKDSISNEPVSSNTFGSTYSIAVIKNCQFSGSSSPYIDSSKRLITYSQNHDLSGYDYMFTNGGTINNLPTDRSGSTGEMWRLVLTDTTRTFRDPLNLNVSQFAVKANEMVTVAAWMKKDHATNCNGRLRVRGYQIAGVDEDVVATLADNTNWQQLFLFFTPTENGVITVEALAEYVSGNTNVYIDQINVTQ